ncbi:MAG TPA: hypothetical protein PLV45_04670, partial [bacterium]|nr:hypothetical protein [bacterium]
MNTVFMRVFQVLLCGLVIGAAVAHSALTEWPAVAPGTPEEAGFTASLRLQPPANRLFSPEEVLAAGRAAGDADTHGGAPYVTLFSNDTTVFNRDGYYHLVQQ